MVVLRTFSKAHGLAGLRVGYGLGPAELLDTARACATHFQCRRSRKPRRLPPSTTRSTFSAWWRIIFCSREFLPRDCRRLVIVVAPNIREFSCSVILENIATAVANRLQDEGVAVRPLGRGAPELHSRDDWHAGAESGVSASGAANLGFARRYRPAGLPFGARRLVRADHRVFWITGHPKLRRRDLPLPPLAPPACFSLC